jgi:hypothetical protein
MTQPSPEGGVRTQRAFGLDVRSFVSFGLRLGAPSGGRGHG